MARVSAFRAVAEAVNAIVETTLNAEGRQIPTFRYGPSKFLQNDHDARVRWRQTGGSIIDASTEGALAPPVNDGDPQTPVYIRRAMALIEMQHATVEDCEHLLDTVLRASRASAYAGSFRWKLARYTFPSQMVGEELQNGTSTIHLEVPIDIQFVAEADGENTLVACADVQLRAGLEDQLDTTTPGQPEFQLNEWT